MIKKYIKKPVEVEATQLTEDNIIEVLIFLDSKNYYGIEKVLQEAVINVVLEQGYIIIETLEGDMKAEFGNYIIKGIKGEFYPCKPDIFEATYQSVDNFIDLNKLKNYKCFTKGAALESQLKKVFEENKEFILETVSKSLETKILTDEELIKNRENIISEGLDVMTSMYNCLLMLGLTKEDFEKHITKLNKYKETKYKK